ncbi:hypothetical protein [Novosphingobium pentaromativorans]|uniref:Uncharacterized protein n=1 Tax=Novosphingobium pentaromativorans US6-1 TaxID=1088721 RepID=G6EKZ1_9SPHN|nr:hypothetical protein [Novosphingobium pentaromativorans]AIT82759.1 hypothetical protein JI59_25265 [Novosphingobium pentaromativorans US6-1]EHJ57958.1 hypothetical protein NSU_pLA1064 [Novosphingobium pentaromativorans US6-1]
MTAVPREGRKVSFEREASTPEADPWSLVSTLCFAIDPPHGGAVLIDFTTLRPRGLALAFARGLLMVIAPRGPVTVRSSIKTYANQLPLFFTYLASTGDRIDGPADLRARQIDGFEAWLEDRDKSRGHAATIVAKVVSVLRRMATDQPGCIDPGLRDRLRYVSSHPYVRSQPRDAYSPFVARQLRDAARADLVAIEARLRVGPLFDEVPDLEAVAAKVHRAIEARGVLKHRDAEWMSLYHMRWNRSIASPDLAMALHGAHYLTSVDIVPLLVLLSLETGLELECCKSLTIDCLRNATGGTVEIAYTKLRAHGAEHKTIRVRDGASTTPGGLIRRILALTAKARVHNDSDCLWIYYQPGEITDGIRHPRATIDAWTARHGIVDDAGEPLYLHLSRLRKTHKALWYLKTEGHMTRFAVGHTVEIAARHYADVPSLRPLHEQAVADALEEAVTGPRIIPPGEEEQLRSPTQFADQDRDDPAACLLDGEQDVWLASCGGFYSSPFGTAGTPCPMPFWGCLDCGNAVITARKLPAILAFLAFVDEQRSGMSQTEWTTKFGHARERIIRQILPAFGEEVVAQARARLAAEPPVIYLPPEARA